MPDHVFYLFDEYAAAYARGERPDTEEYLQRAGAERKQLATLLDEFLGRVPVHTASPDDVRLLHAMLDQTPPATHTPAAGTGSHGRLDEPEAADDHRRRPDRPAAGRGWRLPRPTRDPGPAVAAAGGLPLAATASPALAERAALLEGLQHFDELTAAVSDRTLEIVERRRRTAVVRSRDWLMWRIGLAGGLVGLLAGLAIGFLAVRGHGTLVSLLVACAAAVVLVPAASAGARAIGRRSKSYIQNTVIVGASDVGQAIAEKLLRHPEYGINPIGFVDSSAKELREELHDLPLLGDMSRLQAVVRLFDIQRVIVAFSNDPHGELLDLMRELSAIGVRVDVVPRFYELIGPRSGMASIEGIPLMTLPPGALSPASRMLKRSMDILLSTLGLLLLAPLFLAVALLIKLDSSGPVFFRQSRIGRAGRQFTIIKFRTMAVEADQHKNLVAQLDKHASSDPRMFKIADDPRVTRTGRTLRRWSIDELPELWNVLRGEMSLVGPRPLIPLEDAYVENWARDRRGLRPGITGLWQVLGRGNVPFEEMAQLDYLYATNWSLGHDLRLISRTVPAMFSRGRAI